MADCSAIALAYARMVVPFDDHPELGRYFGRLVERTSVARVLREAAPYMPKG